TSGKQQNDHKEPKEKKDSQQASAVASEREKANEANVMITEVLRELKELRKENQNAFAETKAALTRLETSVRDLKERTDVLEQRLEEAERRTGASEDVSQRNERVLRYMLRREAFLTNQCDDLQNRMRRNNLRIYQVPEGSEKQDMVGFVKDIFRNTLLLQEDLSIERAHRALGSRPADINPPRSIIVRFTDYAAREAVLQRAWSQKQIVIQGKRIYFDQDFSPQVQKKRVKLQSVIKQLKEKGIKAKCRFPAQLRVDLENGSKTFPTLLDAIPTLEKLNISVQMSEREKMEAELSKEAW
uniref:L1 transposable element RRM domain-containing protein n=1 Tax=Poecilia formosa TaxID=48698 RepID=A0A087YQ59_POEFO